MAPERFQGKSDGRDDIYALGATLYEFLALRSVFEASDPHQLLSRIEHDLPTPLRQIDRQIHPDLAAIVARTLAKDPADRYADRGRAARRAAPVHRGTAGQDAARPRVCTVLAMVQAKPLAGRRQHRRRGDYHGPGHRLDHRGQGLLRLQSAS